MSFAGIARFPAPRPTLSWVWPSSAGGDRADLQPGREGARSDGTTGTDRRTQRRRPALRPPRPGPPGPGAGDRLRGVPGPRGRLDRPTVVPVVRLGGLLGRLAQPARQSALLGDRPPRRRRLRAWLDLA